MAFIQLLMKIQNRGGHIFPTHKSCHIIIKVKPAQSLEKQLRNYSVTRMPHLVINKQHDINFKVGTEYSLFKKTETVHI